MKALLPVFHNRIICPLAAPASPLMLKEAEFADANNKLQADIPGAQSPTLPVRADAVTMPFRRSLPTLLVPEDAHRRLLNTHVPVIVSLAPMRASNEPSVICDSVILPLSALAVDALDALVALVAVAALPLMLMPHVPEAPVPVGDGTSLPMFSPRFDRALAADVADVPPLAMPSVLERVDADDALVAVAALPLILMDHVPDAPPPVVLGTLVPMVRPRFARASVELVISDKLFARNRYVVSDPVAETPSADRAPATVLAPVPPEVTASGVDSVRLPPVAAPVHVGLVCAGMLGFVALKIAT